MNTLKYPFRRKFTGDEKGATAIEFAFMAPLLFLLFMVFFYFVMVFMAEAGLKHSIGEAARYATIYPTPSDQSIINRFHQSRFGYDPEHIETVSLEHGEDNGIPFLKITARYQVPVSVPLFKPDGITLEESRRAYLQ